MAFKEIDSKDIDSKVKEVREPEESTQVIEPKTAAELNLEQAVAAASVEKKQEIFTKRRDQLRVSTITVPYNKLSSQGLSYPPNGRVFYNTYSLLETKDLTAKLTTEDKFEIMLSGMFADFNYDSELNKYNHFYNDARDLTYFDFLQLCLLRKLSSFKTERFTIPYYCTKCKSTLTKEFSLMDLSFSTLEYDKLPVSLELSTGETLQFYPLTIGGYLELSKTDVFYRYMPDGSIMLDQYGNPQKNLVALLAKTVVNYPFGEAYDILSSITDIDDMEYIELIDNVLFHGIEPLRFTCPNKLGNVEIPEEEKNKEAEFKLPISFYDNRPECGNKIEIAVREVESLVIPFRTGRDTSKPRIYFGNKRDS